MADANAIGHLRLRRERNHVGSIGSYSRECHPLRLRNAVLTPQVAVRFHRQRPAVFVSEPARNGRNVHAAFDAAGREQMPQIVMGDATCSDLVARPIKRLLAFTNAEHRRSPAIRLFAHSASAETERANQE